MAAGSECRRYREAGRVIQKCRPHHGHRRVGPQLNGQYGCDALSTLGSDSVSSVGACDATLGLARGFIRGVLIGGFHVLRQASVVCHIGVIPGNVRETQAVGRRAWCFSLVCSRAGYCLALRCTGLCSGAGLVLRIGWGKRDPVPCLLVVFARVGAFPSTRPVTQTREITCCSPALEPFWSLRP